MTTTERLWSSIAHVYDAILTHPFVTGLADGSLARRSFSFYVVQDALYLREYARALALCAAKAPGEDAIEMFCEHARGALVVERSLHESFFSDLGISETEVQATPLAPTNLAYTSYLLASVHQGSFAEALGAVLPCYWIYQRVGQELLARGSPDPLYRRWIETYGGEDFDAIVRAVLEVTERATHGLDEDSFARMRERFATTARYEWMFWDMGYRLEAWPL